LAEPLRTTVAGHDGISLCLFEWPGEGPPIFFAHATGFHARCWDQVVARLPGRQCFALDLRGHGRSDKPDPPYVWRNFGQDVAAVAAALGLEGALAVGHSKGGHAVTLAAALRPGAFAALLLVDPVIVTKAAYEGFRRLEPGEQHFAARRRNDWDSPGEMHERFKDRPPFSLWDPAVLRDYCDYGLLPEGDHYVLACPPAIEAAVYAESAGTDIYAELATITAPVRILRARPRVMQPGEMPRDMSASPTAPDLARHFANAEDVPLPGLTHFIPMQDPGLVARHIREMLERMGTSGAARTS
jgi:pimeloyl-ACP methyl ester carboxylesterase